VPEDYTGGAVVGGNLVIDESRKSLYAATGNNYSVPATAAACLKTKTTVAEQQQCLDQDNYVDTVVSLDLADGHLKWAARTLGFDTWTGNCIRNKPLCPDPAGPDYDFASAPNLFHVGGSDGKGGRDILGIGQKNGIYWAFDPDNGAVIWSTKVGPAGPLGGIEWGSAVEDGRLYVAITNIRHADYPLGKDGQITKGGAWNALDAATGEILWQTPTTGKDPKNPELGSFGFGAVSAANGVMYAGTTSGDMVAIDGKTGKLLWQFASGGTVAGGPAIVGDSIYWGSGYTNRNMGSIPNNRLYAFSVSTPGEREASAAR
jgi:polyvinyl alcohol dehydrogenase (cytochrome)